MDEEKNPYGCVGSDTLGYVTKATARLSIMALAEKMKNSCTRNSNPLEIRSMETLKEAEIKAICWDFERLLRISLTQNHTKLAPVFEEAQRSFVRLLRRLDKVAEPDLSEES